MNIGSYITGLNFTGFFVYLSFDVYMFWTELWNWKSVLTLNGPSKRYYWNLRVKLNLSEENTVNSSSCLSEVTKNQKSFKC